MKLLNWIKEKYQHRRNERDEHDPWWVTLMLDVGRPMVAILILTMCAPGEHYIAVKSGLNEKLAWGMPGTLTAYAGIAAVVATKRPKGSPGHKTAVAGAIMAVLLAMAAQPVAHLWGRFGAPSQTQEIWLTIVAGIIPAAVFGHLLHMGAVGKPKTVKAKDAPGRKFPAPAVDTLMRTSGVRPDTDMARDKIAKAMDIPVDMITSPVSTLSAGHDRVFGQDTDTGQDIPADTGQEKKAMSSTTVRPIKSGSVSADVREFLSKHPDASDADLSGHVRARRPGTKWDTIRKARDRFKEIQENTG